MKRIAAVGIILALAVFGVSQWSARQLPTVSQAFDFGRLGCAGVAIGTSFAVSINDGKRTIALENMDGSWSLDVPGLLKAAVDGSALSWWSLRLLAAAPALRIVSFDEGTRIGRDPKYQHCGA